MEYETLPVKRSAIESAFVRGPPTEGTSATPVSLGGKAKPIPKGTKAVEPGKFRSALMNALSNTRGGKTWDGDVVAVNAAICKLASEADGLGKTLLIIECAYPMP